MALHTLREGDSLTVQALPSLRGRTFGAVAEYEVVRTLPDPTLPVHGFRRVLRPAILTIGRSRARRAVLRRGFDLAHIQLLTHETDWLDLRTLPRRPAMVSMVHDVVPHAPSRLGPRIDRALLRRLYDERCTGHLIVFHRVLRDQLVAEFGVARERVHVLAHTLDGSDLRVADATPPARPFVLFFGTLRANKGIDDLLGAAESLPGDPGFDVVVAGEGTMDVEHRVHEAARRCAHLRVETGYVAPERKGELFSTASAVVLPYTSFASQSGVLADCYAYRVPAIVTDVGALGATVRDDATGWVAGGTVDDLADALTGAMAELAGGRDFATALDAAARRHDFATVGPQLRAVYDVVAGIDR
jgi:glycosyltransferase involved in cell wall biosynthesis